MEKIKLVTDSTVDLESVSSSVDLIKELDLEIVPLYVSFDDDDTNYLDGVEIHQNDIVEHVKNTGKLPKTAACGPGVYTKKFNELLNQGYSIIFIGIGSKLSSNYQAAMLGKDATTDPDRITIIDSNNLSSATGLCLLKARDFIKKGLSREEIKTKIETEIAPYIHTAFCINSLDYMVKGGRCSSLTGFLSKILSLKPIIMVVDGKLEVGKKPIGSLNNAIKVIYQDMMKEIKNCELDYLMVTHFISEPCAEYIIPIIEETCKFKNIYNTKAGSVIGSHCGPGTIGLLYITKPPKKTNK